MTVPLIPMFVRTRCRTLAVVLFSCAAAGLGAAQIQEVRVLPQQPARDVSGRPATGSAVLSGTVVADDGSGRPIRRATVNLNGGDARMGQQAMTDDAGRFLFTDLPPGRYSVNVSKQAYINATYPSSVGRAAVTPLMLVNGQQQTITIKLVRGAVIAGTIRDQQGQPVSGIRVQAYQIRMQGGVRTQAMTRSSNLPSDDRGQYRMFGLPPGDYLVAATPNGAATAPAVTEADIAWAKQQAALKASGARGAMTPPPPPGPTMGNAPIYFPGSPESTGATVITVGAGEERSGIDFPLPAVPLAKIEGSVVDPSGRPPTTTAVALMTAETLAGSNAFSLPQMTSPSTRTTPEGKFTFTNVPPGQYFLAVRIAGRVEPPDPLVPVPPPTPIAIRGEDMVIRTVTVAEPPDTNQWGLVDVSVNGRDVSNVGISLQQGMKVSGRIQFDAATLPVPTDLSKVRITLTPSPTTTLAQSVPAAGPHPDGTFTFNGITPGRYRLSATSPNQSQQPGAWMVRSIQFDGRDLQDVSLDVQRTDTNGIVVTFSDRMTDLSGTLFDAASKPATGYSVAIFTVDRSLWAPPSRRVRLIRPTAEGKYRVTNLPPGEYFMLALSDATDFDWTDPAMLEQLSASAFRLTLSEGEKKVQDLRLAGG